MDLAKKTLKNKLNSELFARVFNFAKSTGYESWGLLPREKQKMLDIIKEAKAEGVFHLETCIGESFQYKKN